MKITGYYIEKQQRFVEHAAEVVNGNVERLRQELEKEHESEIYFKLKEIAVPEEKAQVILNAVCEEFNVEIADLLGETRGQRPVAEARIIASTLIMHFVKPSATAIGKLLNRSHATVLYHIRKCKELEEIDPVLVEKKNTAIGKIIEKL